jgi:hypothetical protein
MKRNEICRTPEQAARALAGFVLAEQPYWNDDAEPDPMELFAELVRITPDLDADERREALRLAEARLENARDSISAIREFAGPPRSAGEEAPALRVVGQ